MIYLMMMTMNGQNRIIPLFFDLIKYLLKKFKFIII